MRTFLCLAILLAACGGDDSEPTGTFTVGWSLTDASSTTAPTCDSYKISDIVVTATDTSTNNAHMVSTPCSSTMAMTAPIPLGSYKVKLEAMGTFGDVAGSKEIAGTLTDMQ